MNLDDLKILSKALHIKYNMQRGYWQAFTPDKDPEKAERRIQASISDG